MKILDDNDSPPAFSQSNYSFLIPEGNLFGVLLGSVAAFDPDDKENGLINYRLLEANASSNLSGGRHKNTEVIRINQNSGEIRAATVFDREMCEKYEFRVLAVDAGIPQLTGTALLTVFVTDRNDNPPHWNSTFTFSLLENQRSRVELGTLRAFDRDVGENARLTYRLKAELSDGRFEIDAHSGTLFATGVPLDREREQLVQLEVCASDSGAPALETCALTVVKVLDENDNSPHFVFPPGVQRDNCSTIINASVHSQIGSEIFKLSAEDEDEGPPPELSYRISSGNDYRFFHLDPTNGALTVCISIHTEFIDSLTRLIVLVSDNGVPQRETEANICIRLLDEPRTPVVLRLS